MNNDRRKFLSMVREVNGEDDKDDGDDDDDEARNTESNGCDEDFFRIIFCMPQAGMLWVRMSANSTSCWTMAGDGSV